jgi:hypothetical protein
MIAHQRAPGDRCIVEACPLCSCFADLGEPAAVVVGALGDVAPIQDRAAETLVRDLASGDFIGQQRNAVLVGRTGTCATCIRQRRLPVTAGPSRGNCREGQPITAVHLARMRPLPNLPCREFARGLGAAMRRGVSASEPGQCRAGYGMVSCGTNFDGRPIAAKAWRLTGWLSRKPTRGIAWLRLSASCAKPDCRPGEAGAGDFRSPCPNLILRLS